MKASFTFDIDPKIGVLYCFNEEFFRHVIYWWENIIYLPPKQTKITVFL